MAVTSKLQSQNIEARSFIGSADLLVHPERHHDLKSIPWTKRSDEIGDSIPVCLTGFQLFQKRCLDLVLATVAGLIFFFPMLFIGLAIIWESRGGPVFYKQTRVGLGGRIFNMWKFRSMKTDAEKETGAVWATSDDNRRTKVGAFLRRTSLDELPQLFNVFLGEMSLVGPRPERPIFVNQFKFEIPGYIDRHAVPVGVTGLAQIRGLRGNTCIFKRVDSDLEYAKNWSVLKDIHILFLTVFKGFINKNAY